MKRYLVIALMGATFAGLPMLVGCDKEKEGTTTKTETKNPDGSTSKDEKTTKVDANGATTDKEVHKTTPATNP